LLFVVMLPVYERPEKAPWLRTEDFPQKLGLQVVFYFVPGHILAVFQQTRVATTGRRHADLLNLVVSGIGKAQNETLEFFAEFIFLCQVLQTFALAFRGSNEKKIAVANDHRAGHPAVHGASEAY